jgi:DHA1 family tetracycline resistance protein-like MFS transporter
LCRIKKRVYMTKKSSLYSLVFTIFNDALGWGVVLTIFAPLLMNNSGEFLPVSASLQMQTIVLGLLIACYPLTQFIFLPLIGALSDHMGRKKILEWTTLCAAFTFALSAIAIWKGSLLFLFISRILAGVFSANASTAQAAIADMSSEKEKGKNLSLAGIAGGLSWVVGPPLGGLLSTNAYIPWADFATPFWFVAVLFLLNYWWVSKSFRETFVKTKNKAHDWKQEIKDLAKLSKIQHMTPWLYIIFFFYLGWGFYLLFFPTLLVQRFFLDQSSIGLISGYLSIFWLTTSTCLNQGLAERYKPEAFALLFLPTTGLLVIVLAFVPSISWWYVILPFIALGGSSIWIGLLAFLSNLAGRENQGKVFGIGQSLLALATGVSPIVSGLMAAIDEKIPLCIGGGILLGIGGFALLYYFRRYKRSIHS